MKIKNRGLLVFLLILWVVFLIFSWFFFSCNISPQKGEEKGGLEDEDYSLHAADASGEIAVDFVDDITPSQLDEIRRKTGANFDFVSVNSREEKLMVASVEPAREEAVIRQLRQDNRVEFAEPDYYYHAYAPIPSDPYYKYQWNFEKIGVRRAWDITAGDGVIVAVIDTGVACEDKAPFHRLEDLDKTLFVKGYNFVGKNDRPYDDNGHGTHVAGTIAQSTNNGKGVAGIAFRAKIMPLKVLSGDGFGRISHIADAIRYAADHKAKVINMSLGGPFPSMILHSACKYAKKKGCVIICAAGNSKSTRPGYPAAYRECISVSATRFDDKLAPYSNRGKNIDIAAPGGDTRVDQNGDGKPDGIMQNTIAARNPEKEGYYIYQGTSMASPHVAAVAALVASQGITGPKDIENILRRTARRKNLPLEEGYGAGIIDASAAAKESSVGRGWLKFIIALFVVIIIIVWAGGPFAATFKSPLYYLGVLMGSSGLFFLPLLNIGDFPGARFLSVGVAQWEGFFCGRIFDDSPLFYSALIPLVVAVLFYRTPLRRLASGLALGYVAALIFALIFSGGDIRWIPGAFVLDKLWLLLNIAVSLVISFVCLKNFQENIAEK